MSRLVRSFCLLLTLCQLAIAQGGLVPLEGKLLSDEKVVVLKERFKESRAQILGLTCKMRQAVSSPSRDEPVVAEADVFYLAPDDLLIDYEDEAFVLMQRTRFTQLEPGDDEVETKPLDPDHPTMETMLRELFTGRIDELQGSYDERIEQLPDGYRVVLELKPGEDPHMPAAILVEMEADSLDVRSVALRFPRGFGMSFDFFDYDKTAVPEATFFETFLARYE